MNSRIVWLDALKGFGIIFIMMSHLYFFPTPISLGYGFIPLFFIAAGLTYKPKPFLAEIKQKSKRLLIPYFFYSIIIVLLCLAINYVFHKELTIGKDLFGILYARVCTEYPYIAGKTSLIMGDNQPLWFLPCMFVVYLYLAAYHALKEKQLFVAVVATLTLSIQNLPYQLPWSIDLALMSVLFLLLGYRFKEQIFRFITTSGFNTKNKVIDILCSVTLLMISFGGYYVLTSFNGSCNMSVRNYGALGLYSLPIFFLVGCLYTYIIAKICALLETTWFIKVIAYIGSQSLRLMCIHMFLAYEIFSRIPGHELIDEHLLPFVYIGLVIAVNWMINLILNKLSRFGDICKYI